jgi:UrcA family protein
MMTRMLVSAALAAAALIAAPAAAAPEGSTYLVFVPHGDLDLATPAGERTLERRLDAAARSVCETGSTLREKIAAQSCRAAFARAGQPRISEARRDAGRTMGMQLASR